MYVYLCICMHACICMHKCMYISVYVCMHNTYICVYVGHCMYTNINQIYNARKVRAPTKAKSQEPAYSQALNQNKIDMQRSRSRESVRQTVKRLWWMVFGVETGREVWG